MFEGIGNQVASRAKGATVRKRVVHAGVETKERSARAARTALIAWVTAASPLCRSGAPRLNG
jgi:hypothetical protein